MWLSNRTQAEKTEQEVAQMGAVTIASNPAGVFLDGERRNVTLISPAGYHWLPKQKDAVLVLSCGQEKHPCMLGRQQEKIPMLKPGEVFLSVAPESGIYLRQDGGIELTGNIFVNGVPLALPQEQEESV